MPAPAPNAVVFAIRGPIARSDLPGLSERVCALLARHEGSVLVCDVRSVGNDAVTVDALARLQFAAKRRRCRIELRHASDELLQLVRFMGLDAVLPLEA